MATNVDKAMYTPPTGAAADDTPMMEVEIAIDDLPGEGDPGVGELLGLADVPFDANLAEFIEDNDLALLGEDLMQEVDNDMLGRREWEDAYRDGLRLLGLSEEHRTIPWENASGVFHPMITEAVVRFQADTITETFPAGGPVRTTIIGNPTRQKEQAAARVAEDMNYQLTERMPEYRPEHERMLWNLAIAGSAFKKVYFDPSIDRQVSMFVPAEDVIIPYGVSDINFTPRLTHRMRKSTNDLEKLQATGFYCAIDLDEGPDTEPDEIKDAKDKEGGYESTFDTRHLLYEVHAEVDLKGFEDTDENGEPTGIALPYVITIVQKSGQVLAVRRNWREGDKTHQKRQHFVHYQYIPGFGSYGLGLIHLIGNSARAATSLQRQLIDAGTLSNLPGGFKTRGLRVKGDDTPISPGEFRDVDVPSGAIKDNIMSLPYNEPSQTLLAMMGIVTEDARRLASTADMKISDMSAQAPVGTTLAIIERSLKIMSAVQARVHYALKQELKLIAAVIRDYADPDYQYDTDADGRQSARKEDFSYVEIIPVSNPNASTMAQRVVQYQAVLQLAQTAPQIYNLPKLHRQMLEVLGIKDADQLVQLDEDQKPQDPVSENMDIMNGKPVKAFIYQDHEAHIRVHMAAMQDPKLMQLMGQNPAAQSMMAAAQAHITAHLAFAYRAEIEKQMGVSLPAPGAELPPDVEAQLSKLTADAAGKLLGKNQAEARAQEAAKKAQDPVIQMQQQETQIKQGELELKRERLKLDAARLADEQALRENNAAADIELRATKIGADIALAKAQLEADQQTSGLQVGADIAKTQAKIDADLEQAGVKLAVDVQKVKAVKQAGKPQPTGEADGQQAD